MLISSGERLQEFKIEGFETDPSENPGETGQLCSYHPGEVATGAAVTLECESPVPAWYVRITKPVETDALTLGEVEVEGKSNGTYRREWRIAVEFEC